MELALDGALDLGATLHSGQAFRWRAEAEGWHRGFIEGRPVRLRVDEERLWVDGDVPQASVRRYLRLDGSHEAALATVRRDAAFDAAFASFSGLRLLKQDPWETFVGYILSANSNVAKIQRTLERLILLAPPRRDQGPVFPSAAELARLDEPRLRSTGMGYRAPHLLSAAKAVARGDIDLDALERASYDEAHAALVEVSGVGDKVADCIQLYGMGHLGAFPLDVWIHRVVRESYFPRKRLNYRSIGDWARRHYGPAAGYAQHYLFHHRRTVGPLPRVVA